MSSPIKDTRKKRSKSLGGDEKGLAGPAKSILKPFINAENTVIGVMEVALKDESDEKKEKENRRKSLLNRRVSFAATASVRTFQTTPSPGTSVSQTPGDTKVSSPNSSPRRSPRSPRTPSPRKPLRVITPPMNFNNPDDELSDEEEDMQISNDDETATFNHLLRCTPLDYDEEMTMELTALVPPPIKASPSHKKAKLVMQSPIKEYKIAQGHEDEISFDTKAKLRSTRGPRKTSPRKDAPYNIAEMKQFSRQGSPLIDYTDLSMVQNIVHVGKDVDDTAPMEMTSCPPFQMSRISGSIASNLEHMTSEETPKRDSTDVVNYSTIATKTSSYASPQPVGNFDQLHNSDEDETVEMEFTSVQSEELGEFTQNMDVTKVISGAKLYTPQRSPTSPQSDAGDHHTQDMDITMAIPARQKRLSSSFHTPLRLSRRGSLAVEMLTGVRQQDSPMIGSPKAVEMLTARRSMAGAEDLKKMEVQPLQLGQWKMEEFGGGPRGIQRKILLLTPRKAAVLATPEKLSSIKRRFGNEKRDSPSPKRSRLTNLLDTNSATLTVHEDSSTAEDRERPSIRLDDFLRMVSVTFLDGLTTTRRRETLVIPNNYLASPSLGDYVHASISTLPLLEMYQFSCKELKKYISEGRDVVERIDRETLEETPLLFHEYSEAGHELRQIMDGQFRLLKSHSRLLAKGVWYEWRKKLMQGVSAIMEKNLKGLLEDEESVERVEKRLSGTFDRISKKHADLKEKLAVAKQRKNAIEASDKTESASARNEMESLAAELQLKKKHMGELSFEVAQMHTKLAKTEADCNSLKGVISDARRIQRENRGHDYEEIAEFKGEKFGSSTNIRKMQGARDYWRLEH